MFCLIGKGQLEEKGWVLLFKRGTETREEYPMKRIVGLNSFSDHRFRHQPSIGEREYMVEMLKEGCKSALMKSLKYQNKILLKM